LHNTAIARDIANKLGETDPSVKQSVKRIVTTLGQETALTLLEESLDIESAGGMMTADGSRERTRGGVFFFLVKQRCTNAQRRRIFGWAPTGNPPTTPKKQQVQPTMSWDERIAAVEQIIDGEGSASTVKITLIGTIRQYLEKGSCVLAVIRHDGVKMPSLPKGVPAPPATKTNYILYIGLKQWKEIAEAAKDSEETFIVEGFPQMDKDLKGISVFVTSIKSKKQLEAKRPARERT
jgi:hypothetical protein